MKQYFTKNMFWLISGDDCSEVDCPGEPNCNDRGFCNSHYDPPRCTNCDEGWMGPACDDACLHGTPDAENTMCVCDQTCWNSTGCDIECSGNGVCNGDGSCNCTYLLGYTGTYCEVPGMYRLVLVLDTVF